MFDYILTGPISGVSAGLYLTGLINELLGAAHVTFVLPMNWTAAFVAVLVTVFFWWENIKGLEESSEKALRIMYVTTVMVVIMIVWCGYTFVVAGAHLPPLPRLENLAYSEDALGCLAMYLAGPMPLRIAFRGFVAIVGTLMLAGAVNTSIVGSNGVLNRVSEDGILPEWFRQPHRRFGTSHHILNLVVALQLFTIVLSRGNIFILGEAYAFGVMWSFAMKGLGVLVLRFKQPGEREFRVPFNLKIRWTES